MKYLMSISIGPVQGFIAAARKTRDLWYGSQLLSDLSKAVAVEVSRSGEMIFPTSNCLRSNESVANKILAIVETNDPDDIADKARNAARSLLLQRWNAALEKSGNLVPKDRVAIGRKQIEKFLEFYSAWYPCADKDDYDQARQKVEWLLAGRKSLRNFDQADGHAGVPKSSMDGGLEAIIDPRQQSSSTGIKRGELLDAISIIKRIEQPKRFVSVSRVAADPVLRKLSDNALQNMNDRARELQNSDLVQRFPNGVFPNYDKFAFDTQLFYEPLDLTDEDNEQNKQLARELFAVMKKGCDESDLRLPSPYFAVLAADGDRMGAAITGMKSADQHRQLSEALSAFAKQADKVVKDAFGVMVYSGGDDVLAFLPIDTAIGCAEKLNAAFTEQLSKAGVDNPTMSCGISIAHYGENLQQLLQWARNAESAAKKAGRRRLAIYMHTRTAGNDYICAIQEWNTYTEGLAKHWDDMVALYKSGGMPDGAIYELRKLAGEFEGTSDGVIEAEIMRILKRKRAGVDMQLLDAEFIGSLVKQAGSSTQSLKNMVSEMIIARKISQALPEKEVMR